MRCASFAWGLSLVACAQSAPSQRPAASPAALACPDTKDGLPRLVVRRARHEDSRYRLLSTTVALDGQIIYKSTNEAELGAPLAIIYDAPASAGPHQLLTAYTVRTIGVGPHATQNGSRFYVPHEHWLVVPEQGVECATLTLSATGHSGVSKTR